MFERKCITYDDVNLVIRLYELRREQRMREARDWFAANFHAATIEEFHQLCPPGSAGNASFRMVTSYWNMAAGFVTSDVLHPELFFKSNREMLVVWTRIEALLPALREMWADAYALEDLEQVAKEYLEWMSKRSPDWYPAFRKRILTPSHAGSAGGGKAG